MDDTCDLCGKKLKHDEEKKAGLCKSCMHKGYLKLGDIIGALKKQGKD